MRLSAMGDVAMTVPVLRAFVDQYQRLNHGHFRPFQTFLIIPNLTFLMKKKGTKVFLDCAFVQDLKELKLMLFADLHNVCVLRLFEPFSLSGKKQLWWIKEEQALTRK
jgi:hypothetical protein